MTRSPVTPNFLPSLPPSPGSANGHPFLPSESQVDETLTPRAKSKQREVDGSTAGTTPMDIRMYPPVNEGEIETKLVEGTLRRWELAEKQRRKALRESSQNATSSTSFLGGISRRASLLWPAKRSSFMPLHDSTKTNDQVPGIAVDSHPINRSPPSPAVSSETIQNPFEALPQSSSYDAGHDDSPSISAANSFEVTTPGRKPPPPKSLGLPPPRTPPPIVPPSPDVSKSEPADETPVRWWHDWLCGCSEGPDRGGDHQAGRTNPFE